MRVLGGLCVVVLMVAVPAYGTSFGLPNEVRNGGFDEGLDHWDVTGPVGIWAEGVPEPSAAIHSHWGGLTTGSISQAWPTEPGIWDVDISFWWKAYDTAGGPTRLEMDFTVNGEVVYTWSSAPFGAPDAWLYEEIILIGVDIPAIPEGSYKDIHFRFYASGEAITGVAVDNIDVEQVPEPTTLALLAFGLSVMLVRRRRR